MSVAQRRKGTPRPFGRETRVGSGQACFGPSLDSSPSPSTKVSPRPFLPNHSYVGDKGEDISPPHDPSPGRSESFDHEVSGSPPGRGDDHDFPRSTGFSPLPRDFPTSPTSPGLVSCPTLGSDGALDTEGGSGGRDLGSSVLSSSFSSGRGNFYRRVQGFGRVKSLDEGRLARSLLRPRRLGT